MAADPSLTGSDGGTMPALRYTVMATEASRMIRVAIVDDDESLRRSLGRLLRAAGMEATGYASAEEFYPDARLFDCLVIDIQLPGMSGLELQDHLAAEGVTTPRLIVTAHDDPKSREAALAGGCAAYFRKTDAGGDVLNAIRRVARR
jgi:FixJ family two-component response regulator